MSTNTTTPCPCCAETDIYGFHEVENVPVNSVLMLKTREEAIAFPKGDIALGLCRSCGFVYNTAFDSGLLEYSDRYDPTQAFSAVFNQWHRKLAEQMIERHGLRNKRVIEIGCGKGEFLHLLCELGDNHGIGFDPAYDASRDRLRGDGRAEFVADFYSEKYAHVRGDFVCCKMTLEHIQPAASFVDMVRRSVGDARDTTVLFQVPDVLRILEETAFWDVYYEHCAYYSAGSLSRLFARCGFEVLEVAREYDGQYLMLVARPSGRPPALESGAHARDDLDQLLDLAQRFAASFEARKRQWRERLERERAGGRRVVIWGSGSKGVSFLTTLGLTDTVEYVVDINPHRHGYYMAGTGQRIVSPEFLPEYRPDLVIVMNPVYHEEVVLELSRQSLAPEVIDAC